MPIIDSKSESKFDVLIRTRKADALLAFIMATYNVADIIDEKDRKEKIAEHLIHAYDLFKGSSGTYGAPDKILSNQFDSHYTMAKEMGIWTKGYYLRPLAKKVANYEITVSEYIGIVFLNLFAYYLDAHGEKVYHHYLYNILKKAKDESVLNSEISKEIISKTLPEVSDSFKEKKKKEQVNIIFNYLISSDLFDQVDDDNFKLSNKWENKGDLLINCCNLEYQNTSYEDIMTLMKDNDFYPNYITKLSNVEEKSKSKSSEKFKEISSISKENPFEYKTNSINKNIKRNIIYFGAPGTGKSYTLNKEKEKLISEGGSYERVTFYPDYSYSKFVGTYKPTPFIDSYGNENITYKYIPGPFMRTLVKALKDPHNPHLLIIEEINRANIAAVFGEVFQLLDRDENNISEYSISTSKEARDYLSESLNVEIDSCSEIKIPSNMFIWATMNSADQGVFPMDTAFKRRWHFEYISIDSGEDGIKDKMVTLGKGENKHTIEWNSLRKAINEELLRYKLNEDKLIGPYFISKKVIPEGNTINAEDFIDVFKNKVLMYLFDDAVRHKRNTLFSGCDENHRNQFSKICDEFDEKGMYIFSENISSNIKIYDK